MSECDSTAPVEYRPIDGFPGYRVGSDGSVWSCKKRKGMGYGRGVSYYLSNEWRRLVGGVGRQRGKVARLNVCLSDGKRITNQSVHRLILEAFVGPCPEGMEGCHNNGNPTDNRLVNLRWDTSKQNHADRDRHGRTVHGEKHHKAKLTKSQVQRIRELRNSGMTYSALARMFSVTIQAISAICKRTSWKSVE